MDNTKLQKYIDRNLMFNDIFKNVLGNIKLISIKISSIEVVGIDNDCDEVYKEMMDSIVYLTNEIHWLITGGFSEGAYARLRLLYEYIVKFTIINHDKKEEVLIKRYKLNNLVYDYKKMNRKDNTLFKNIKEYAKSNSLKKEFYYLLSEDYIDDNWWFGILLDNNKNNNKIGFSKLNNKFNEIQNKLIVEDELKLNDNILFKYTSEKVHMFSKNLNEFNRILIARQDVDEKLYLDDIIEAIQIMVNELITFLYINFTQEKKIIEFVFKYGEKINIELDEIKEKYGC
ncbi:hypothetical protein EQZ09_08810 [Clostridium perfringens]|nr:hypothetical protein [Clostridium perfringens]